MTWLEQYTANYNGTSAEAKSLEPYLKTTYKGAKYIPWATMERLTYMQDPDADFTIIPSSDDTFVHTSVAHLTTSQEKVSGTTVEKTDISNAVFAHFVMVSLTFLGKTFTEVYPIQDTAQGAPKAYDQNLVNRALQRAKAKIASRATGLALRLYESLDLQFEGE